MIEDEPVLSKRELAAKRLLFLNPKSGAALLHWINAILLAVIASFAVWVFNSLAWGPVRQMIAKVNALEYSGIGWFGLLGLIAYSIFPSYAYLSFNKGRADLIKRQAQIAAALKWSLVPGVIAMSIGGMVWSEYLIAEKGYVRCPVVHAEKGGPGKREFPLEVLAIGVENCPPLTFTGEIEDWRWVLQRRKEAAAQ